jgi:hypothetical protein
MIDAMIMLNPMIFQKLKNPRKLFIIRLVNDGCLFYKKYLICF